MLATNCTKLTANCSLHFIKVGIFVKVPVMVIYLVHTGDFHSSEPFFTQVNYVFFKNSLSKQAINRTDFSTENLESIKLTIYGRKVQYFLTKS